MKFSNTFHFRLLKSDETMTNRFFGVGLVLNQIFRPTFFADTTPLSGQGGFKWSTTVYVQNDRHLAIFGHFLEVSAHMDKPTPLKMYEWKIFEEYF